jgi:hypothetical protein
MAMDSMRYAWAHGGIFGVIAVLAGSGVRGGGFVCFGRAFVSGSAARAQGVGDVEYARLQVNHALDSASRG